MLLLLCLLAGVSLAQAPRTKPLAQGEVQQLLQSGVPMQRIVALVEQLGIEFDPTAEIQAAFESAGADDTVLAALRFAGAKWHIRRGRDFHVKGQYAEAEQAARAALRLGPDSPQAHHLLGDALWSKEDHDGALAAYRELIRLQPGNAEGHVAACAQLNAKGDFEAALPVCREALRLAPNHAGAHFWLGVTLANKGDFTAALIEFREGVRLEPQSGPQHDGSCWALRSLGDNDGALIECREALRLDPKNPWIHNNAAATFMAKSDFAGAEVEYREALRLKPDFLAAKSGLCWALASKNDFDAAIAVCQDAVRQKPNDPWVRHAFGFLWERKGNVAAALEEYRAAFLALPQNAIIKGSYDRMLQQSQRASQMVQRMAQAAEFIGRSSFPEAEQAFREVLQHDPKNRHARFGLGDALQGQSRSRDATAEYLAASHGPAVFRINTGGAYRDSQGCVWEKDRYYNKGRSLTAPAARKIEGTNDPALFQAVHYHNTLLAPAPFEYRFLLADGEYRVNLYFMEAWPAPFLGPPAMVPGGRVFNVTMNGTTVFDSVDTFSAVGAYRALVLSTRVRVQGGTLGILFAHRTFPHGAFVAAIEVIAVESKPK